MWEEVISSMTDLDALQVRRATLSASPSGRLSLFSCSWLEVRSGRCGNRLIGQRSFVDLLFVWWEQMLSPS